MITDYYIFVEGTIDKLFIEKLFCDKLSLFGKNNFIIEYATKDKKKIKGFITSVNKMENSDYIFLADQDGREDKKQIILDKYPYLDEKKVFISIYEIESWIISGISQKLQKKYKIKPLGNDTSKITKENFEKLIPKSVDKIEFIAFLIDDYNINSAILLNKSLNTFYSYLENKKAS